MNTTMNQTPVAQYPQAVKYLSYTPVSFQDVHFTVPPPPVKSETTRLVDFRGVPRDWSVLLLTMFGFSQKAIAKSQGISQGMVCYRLKKFNKSHHPTEQVRARNYRDGTSPVAQMVIEATGRKVKQMLAPAVSKVIADTSVIEV